MKKEKAERGKPVLRDEKLEMPLNAYTLNE